MGCGQTLRASASGEILCGAYQCPRPTAVGDILTPRNIEHEVTFTATGFQVVHPLRERFDDLILRCPLDAWLGAQTGSPVVVDGPYTATTEAGRPGWWFSAPGTTRLQALTEQLSWWGEDSEEIGLPGHVDLVAFTAAARELYWKDRDTAPGFSGEARHVWMRSLTVDARLGDDENYEPCEATDSGAEAYTVIDIDQ
jgi:uncharacterized protein DUF6085